MDKKVPSGTVTFLFTDIEGSTKLARDLREAWNALQQRHHVLLTSEIEAHNGFVFQIIGDAFCAAFHTAEDALQAAVGAQHRLQTEDWGTERIKVRMGLNTGAAQAGTGADGAPAYTGYSTLARAQRVMSTAHGEQILLSNTTAELLLGELPEGISLRDMKDHRLKGLLNPEHLRQALSPGLREDFPALQTLNSIPNNLPIQLTSFVGREMEIAAIQKLMEAHRLVTLTGSGGVGKTRHALQVGAEMLDGFPDGVWLVDLAPVSDPDLVLHAISSALKVREDGGGGSLEALQDHLESKHVLLLLDNCEHLLSACAQIAESLLRACPHLKMLTSSREALGAAGEVTFRVTSLALPDPHNLPSLENMTQYDSVRLFIERAVAVKPGFVITNENAPAVAQVCARLDGIPLAIELAAARVPGLAVEQISKRLDDRFKLLTGGSRTALLRHQTLRAMIEWSHELLTEAERIVFRRLSVFVDDWTLEAAEQICGEGGIAEADVMDLMLRLVAQSLVSAEERAGQARYRMLETIGDFAREKLKESGEESAVRARHLEWFLHFSEQSKPELEKAESFVWLTGVQPEYDNLQAALEWAATAGTAQPAQRLAAAAAQLADVRERLGLRVQAAQHYQQALAFLDAAPADEVRIQKCGVQGKLLYVIADLRFRVDPESYKRWLVQAEASADYLQEALKAAEGEPPSAQRAEVLNALAIHVGWARVQRDTEAAERYARAAVEVAEQLDAPTVLCNALGTLDTVLFLRAKWRERIGFSERRLRVSRDPRVVDVRQRADALIEAAHALTCVGDYEQALPHVVEAARLAAEHQLVELERTALSDRTDNLFRLDRWDEVLELDERLRDMQQRYPVEKIGPSCYSIAVESSVHALRGEADLALRGREEARGIMISISGQPEHWNRLMHY